jgi:hypothetical protein
MNDAPKSQDVHQAGVPRGEPNLLLEWSVMRWRDEVQHRPLVNKHRRTLDDTWRQVMRFAGGDPDALVGPSHDELLADHCVALRGEPEAAGQDWRRAVALAYGHLWHVNNEPMAPVPLRSPETAAYAARKVLRDLLTNEERGEAINAVQALLASEPPQAASGCSHTARSDGQEMFPRCTEKLRAAGKAYPRTCAECGLGPCRITKSAEQGATPPAPATPPGHWDEYAMREARRLWNLPAMPKGQLVASLHCALIDAMRFAASPQPAAPVEDLAMMIRMLVSSLKRHWPHAPQPNDLPSRAMELLRRHGLQGSPLREADDGAPKQSTAAVKRDYCPEKLKPGGCQLHNLHCGYPKCNASPAAEGGAS